MHLRYRFPGIFLIALALFLSFGLLMTNKAFADTAIVTTDVLNIRAGPGTGYNIVTQVNRNERLSVLDKSGDWYCVSLPSGQKGWLAGWLVNIEKSPAQAAPSSSTAVRVNGNAVNIRSGPTIALRADLDALLKDKAKLTAVLTYHVVPGKVMAKDVKAGNVKTVQGSDIMIATMGGVKVNNANVTATDIAADNGVIHVLDTVIMPK